ncbi:MAG: prolipoprotein diacylglyceryl transferase, partial [Bdellovibrionales bacterium]|nr:prolipoprotein diacylglyceryl transferase [Bdellovibrionales bacterium]
HSVAGALFGGIFSTEIYKWLKGVRGSTGSLFVPSLALGIAIGRLGCFFSGLVDHTYGIATNLPWAINFGDSIFRHPVQLYESLSMFIFFWIYVALRKQKPFLASQIGFYLFIMYYASQRFLWEFYKPYARVWGKMNLFHLVCLGLIFYAALCIFYRRHYARHASSAN